MATKIKSVKKKKIFTMFIAFIILFSFNSISAISNTSVTKTEYSGDSTNRWVDITNENGIVTRSIFDRFGNLVEIIEAKGTGDEVSATYTYDILGNLKTIRDPENHITTNYYNSLNQLIREEHPDTGITRLEYDLNGNLIKTTDDLGRVIKRDYDELDRIKYIDYDDDESLEVQYLYDNECGNEETINSVGRVCKILDLSGTIEFVYDNRGRIILEDKTIDETTYTTKYEYDDAGNIISMIYPSGKKVIYNYNILQQLESVQLDADNDGEVDETIISDYDYNPTGTTNQVNFGDSITTTYDYTIRDWLKSINSGSSIFQRSYSYDPIGNIMYMYNDPNLANQISEFSYDRLNRLVSTNSDIFGAKTYTYDKVGNRISLAEPSSTTYTYDYQQQPSSSQSIKLKQISTTSGTTNLEYDTVGNLKSDNNYLYNYDHENRLISVSSSNGTLVEEYVYDYLGNRVKKISGENIKIYLYDLGGTLIEERMEGESFEEIESVESGLMRDNIEE